MEFSAGPPPSRAWTLLLLLPLLGAFIGLYVLVAPTHLAYEITPSTVKILAGVGAWEQGREIPRSDILGAETYHVTSARRTAGTGLPGYCQGHWNLSGLGTVWLASDCRQDVVALHTRDGAVVISPPDEEAFMAALGAPEGTLSVSLPPAEHPGWVWGIAVLLVGGPVVSLVLLRALLRPLVYRIEGSTLLVPRSFGVLRLPLPHARVTRGDLRGSFRLAGTALPGFYLGRFGGRAGTFHAAASRRDDGVYIESSTRVFVTPADVTAFLHALARAGALTNLP